MKIPRRRTDQGHGPQVSTALAVTLLCVVGVLQLPANTLAAGPAAAAQANDDASAQLAGELLGRAAVDRGLCVVLGGDGSLPLELAAASKLLVHVRDPRSDVVEKLRRGADELRLGIERLTVERGPITKLPHADGIVDVVIAPAMTTGQLRAGLSESGSLAGEVLRALCPEGTAIIGVPGGDPAKLAAWARDAGAVNVSTSTEDGTAWLQFSRPERKGAGEWSHWEHGPDNNPVSEDMLIKAPYMTQFMAKPFYIAMPSITTAAGGRTFLAIGHIAHHRREWDTMNKLVARNGYNGTVLWERPLPEGYLVHRSAFIATKQTFYMIDGNHCLLLDAATGREQGEIRIPGVAGEWKWMVMKDGVLYVLAGKPDPPVQTTKGDRSFGGWSWSDLSRGYYRKPRLSWGFGDTLAAYAIEPDSTEPDSKEPDSESPAPTSPAPTSPAPGKRLWIHKEEKPMDSRAMSMGEDRLSIYCPDAHLRCLDLKTGEVLWTNDEKETLDLIEQPGQGLTSTPGFRTACLSVYTPNAIIIQGQTRMNVVAISPKDGYLLWTKKKVTNNPNAIFVDDRVILGIGPGGSHVAVEPTTGTIIENLGFNKRACTRLTACSDSFFVRGEGTLRYDREKKKVLVDGAARPACNDGALPANGLLYVGPWQCDCNLSLIGRIGRCSAGDFQFDREATEEDRLELGTGVDPDSKEPDSESPAPTSPALSAPLAVDDSDWPTYRADNDRSSGTGVAVRERIARRWEYRPDHQATPSAPVSAGGLIFVASEDGRLRALDADGGTLRWEFATSSPIMTSPTVDDGRIYFGGGDGYAYCLEAASGRMLWRFRAAPVERHILVYGHLSSTWPVNSGVLVKDGVAYFAAGIVDYDGTYVYALDAKTGRIKWQNHSSGHLSDELRKGVSVQGNLTVQGNRLLLAGGNQVSPAPYKLATGECLAPSLDQGQPKANNGRFAGSFRGRHAIVGGRIIYSAPENVSTKGSFQVVSDGRKSTLSYGGVPPSWDKKNFVLVNYQHGQLTCCDADKVETRIGQGAEPPPAGARRRFRRSLADDFKADGAIRWESNLGEPDKFEAVSMAVCPNAIVAVVQYQQKFRAQPQWYVTAFNVENGQTYWRQEIIGVPLPGGILVDRDGRVVVAMIDGTLLGFAGQ